MARVVVLATPTPPQAQGGVNRAEIGERAVHLHRDQLVTGSVRRNQHGGRSQHGRQPGGARLQHTGDEFAEIVFSGVWPQQQRPQWVVGLPRASEGLSQDRHQRVRKQTRKRNPGLHVQHRPQLGQRGVQRGSGQSVSQGERASQPGRGGETSARPPTVHPLAQGSPQIARQCGGNKPAQGVFTRVGKVGERAGTPIPKTSRRRVRGRQRVGWAQRQVHA